MWLLVKLNAGTTKYLISENESYTVGRKNCDIVLEGDASISRKHCTLYVTKPEENSTGARTKVCVLDEQSKYGTFLKNDDVWLQLNPNERQHLTNGSIIKFGLLENNWRLEYKPILACTTGVPPQQKKTLETVLKSIDGHLKSAYSKECSLVIANEIILTVKVVLALINGTPIVTPAYIEKVAEAVKNQTEFPGHENYRPAIKENILDKSLVSLDTKNHRRELFKGKKFIVPTGKQMEILREVIECAGGTAELYSAADVWESFADNDVIVIQLPSNCSGVSKELIKSFKEMDSFLKDNYGKRVVPESEIAQAVAYSSVEKFCNPQSNCFGLRIGERKQLDLGPSLVEETPAASEISQSQLGVVCASATCGSETPLRRNSELHPRTDKTAELQPALATGTPPKARRVSRKPFSQRKRTHNSDPVDQETPNKRARNRNDSDDESSLSPTESSTENEDSHDEPVETKGNANPRKTADAASSGVASNLRKRKGSPSGKIRVGRQSSSEFWDCGATYKRKNSSENQNPGEEQSRKKAKLSEPTTSKQRPSETAAREDRKRSSPSPQRTEQVAEENAFTDYFGKETTYADTILYDLSNTILSLTIIPPSFLKEDGSLVDPPDVPVNVKKFKKQKIFSVQILNPPEEDELSDGEWIEPHSNCLNISVLEGDKR